MKANDHEIWSCNALPENNKTFDDDDVFMMSSCILGSARVENSRKSELPCFSSDLLEKAKFVFKPMYDRRMLVISSKDMETTTFDSLRKAAKAIGVSFGALRYAKNKEKDFVKKDEEIYKIEWC